MHREAILLTLALVMGMATSARTEVGAEPQSPLRLTPDYLNRLAEEMRTNNPALQAARSKVSAARLNQASVRRWDDPMFRFGGIVRDTDGPSSAMVGGAGGGGTGNALFMSEGEEGDLYYELEQKLPLFGKAKFQRLTAEAEQSVAAANADYAFQVLRRDLTFVLLRLALAHEVVAIGQQDLRWLETIAAAAESRFLSRETSQFEVLRLHNEKALRADQLRTDARDLDRERWAANRLLNRPTDASWPAFQLPEVAQPIEFSPRLLELALRYEPKLTVLQREIQVSSNILATTRRQRHPDISLGAEGRQSTDTGEFTEGMFYVRLNLPWFNLPRYRREILRDQEKLKAAQLDAADYALAVRDEAFRITVRLDAARRQAVLYRDEIIPRAEQALAVTQAGWTANRGLFLEVMDARRALLEARVMFTRAVAEQYQMLADLVLCCGLADLEALDMLAPANDTTAIEEVKKPMHQPLVNE
jgi:outer membrane protein TolC